MRRREALLAAAALAVAPALRAQAPRLRRVAIAGPGSLEVNTKLEGPLKARLAELGWVEGRTVEYVSAASDGDAARYEPMIAGLLAQKPDVLVVTFTSMAAVAKKLTQTVPVVFTIASNPEKAGVVSSLGRPGGNVTGVSTRELELLGKRIELLKEITPGMRRVAVLTNPNCPAMTKFYLNGYAPYAREAGLQVITLEAGSAGELGPQFERVRREGVQGILVTADAVHYALRSQVVSHAARVRVPGVYTVDEWVDAGGLASYGTHMPDQFRRAAGFVDKILRGAKPADLPVEEPTNFELALNMKAAREQGIKLPQSVLVRATRVVE